MSRFVLLAAASALLSGCISLVPPAKTLPPRYTLNAADADDPGKKLDITLAVADARAEGAINTAKIAVKTGRNEIRYMPGGEWSDRAPRIFSLLLERSFEARGRLLAVSDLVALPTADYRLYADIEELNVDRTTDPSTAQVGYRVRLETRRGEVIGARSFDADVPVTGSDTRAAASAIDAAAARAASETAAWALGLIEAAEAGRS